MKILLLNLPNPPGMRLLRDFGGGFGTALAVKNRRMGNTVFPPLHEAFTAAILEREGFDVAILDGQNYSRSGLEFLQAVEKQNAQVIVCRVSAPSFDNDLAIISSIKELLPKTFLVGWGSLCKIAPGEVLRKSRLNMVVGEAELEFAILQILKKGNIDFSCCTIVRNESNYVDCSRQNISGDLDSLPPPAYNLLDFKKYLVEESSFVSGAKSKLVRFASVLSSHGCSFNCMYCVYPKIFGKWRGRSPSKVVDDIEVLVADFGVKLVWFEDQAFSMDINRASAICDKIIDRGINVRWACETRADKVPNELLKKMKRAGCSRIQLGIETGDPALFSQLGKSGCNLETVIKNIKAIKQENILVETNFIVGLPGESWKSVKNTSSFIGKLNPDVLSVSIATPYPGTRLYELAQRNDWILTRDWNKYGLNTPVLSMPTFTANDMARARDYLLSQASFSREWNQLRMDFRSGHIGRVLKKVIMNISKMPRHLYKMSKS